jgi:hypothetical protein
MDKYVVILGGEVTGAQDVREFVGLAAITPAVASA